MHITDETNIMNQETLFQIVLTGQVGGVVVVTSKRQTRRIKTNH